MNDDKQVKRKLILKIFIVHGIIAILLCLCMLLLYRTMDNMEGGIDAIGKAIAYAIVYRISALLLIVNLFVFGARMLNACVENSVAKLITYSVVGLISCLLCVRYAYSFISLYNFTWGFTEFFTLVSFILFLIFLALSVWCIYKISKIVKKIKEERSIGSQE